jgi:hypothetical protein
MDLVPYQYQSDMVMVSIFLLFKIFIMAKQRDSKLVGTAGNLIFYNWRGEYCMRTKPVHVRRSGSTIQSASNFGRASKICRQIRQIVVGINPGKTDNRLMYRLTGALNKLISWEEKRDSNASGQEIKLPFLDGFQFNSAADLGSIRVIRPSLNAVTPNLTEINLAPFIPNQSLNAPSATDHILFRMILIGMNLKEAKAEMVGRSDLKISYDGDLFQPPTISIPAAVKSGDLAILVMSVQYMINRNGGVELLKDEKKLPCGVIWAGTQNASGALNRNI